MTSLYLKSNKGKKRSSGHITPSQPVLAFIL